MLPILWLFSARSRFSSLGRPLRNSDFIKKLQSKLISFGSQSSRTSGPLFEDLIGLVESRKINANLPLNRRDMKSPARTVLQRISYVMTPPPCAQVPRADNSAMSAW